jgi:hypothetical protein
MIFTNMNIFFCKLIPMRIHSEKRPFQELNRSAYILGLQKNEL